MFEINFTENYVINNMDNTLLWLAWIYVSICFTSIIVNRIIKEMLISCSTSKIFVAPKIGKCVTLLSSDFM